jgi:hypothetical protein
MTHLLLDSRKIARTENAELRLGTIRKDARNPLMIEDRPWEKRFDNLYPNVFYDADRRRYQLWYGPFIVDDAIDTVPIDQRHATRYFWNERREMGLCYAESDDGIVWQKPELGRVDYQGSCANNIVKRPTHGPGVEVDLHDADPSRRYKVLTCQDDKPDQMAVAFSADGLQWSEYVPCPEMKARGDTHNNFFWHESRRTYVGLTRLWDGDQRVVGWSESPDFLHWTAAKEVMRRLPHETTRQVYELLGFAWGDVCLGFVMMFNIDSDTVDCELAWSPDSVRWERICPGQSIIPRGQACALDCGCIYAAKPIVVNGEIRLYYGASDGPHTNWRKGSLALARLGMDRFAGMTPIDATRRATIVTTDIEWTAPTLTITADIAAGGSVRVGIVGESAMTPAACQPIAGTVTDGKILWPGVDTTSLIGRKVSLIFEIAHATVYGFSFGEIA